MELVYLTLGSGAERRGQAGRARPLAGAAGGSLLGVLLGRRSLPFGVV